MTDEDIAAIRARLKQYGDLAFKSESDFEAWGELVAEDVKSLLSELDRRGSLLDLVGPIIMIGNRLMTGDDARRYLADQSK